MAKKDYIIESIEKYDSISVAAYNKLTTKEMKDKYVFNTVEYTNEKGEKCSFNNYIPIGFTQEQADAIVAQTSNRIIL